MTPAEHAATVRDALKNPVVWDGLEMQFDALTALVTLAERATELERELDECRAENALCLECGTWSKDWRFKADQERERAERAETALRAFERNDPAAMSLARAALGETAPSAPSPKTSS